MSDNKMDVEDTSSRSADSGLETQLGLESDVMKKLFHETFQRFVAGGDDPNVAAVKAIYTIRGVPMDKPVETSDMSMETEMHKEEEEVGLETKPPSPPPLLSLPPEQQDHVMHDDEVEQDASQNGSMNEETSEKMISFQKLSKMLDEAKETGSYLPIIRLIGSVFSDPMHVVSCFSTADKKPDLKEAKLIFELVESVTENEGVCNSLRNALIALASQLNYPINVDDHQRFIPAIVALEYEPFQYDPDLLKTVSTLFHSIKNMPKEAKENLVRFWSAQTFEYLERLLATIQMFITLKVTLNTSVADFRHVREGVVVLDLLHRVNEEVEFTQYQEFYNSAVNELATEDDYFLKEDLIAWFRAHHEDADEEASGHFSSYNPNAIRDSFCDFPFILDPGSKARVLQLEARVQQQSQYQDSMRERFRGRRSTPYFHVRIRRNELVNDVLDTIAQCDVKDFKKPLRVEFEGEEGVDEGGVRKEFFLLMVRKLMDPNFGMFTMDPDSRLLWFNINTFEIALKFELVGYILGLAIYNGVILDLNFPLALYKKLLKKKTTLEDVKQLHPALGRGLQELLDYDGDVESTFCRSFQYSYDAFGEVRNIDLKENGSEIAVTNDNRQEYVDLYIDYLFNKSIEPWYEPFHKGFHAVAGGIFLEMFQPEEMELLLCGSRTFDFEELESSCSYENGFTRDSPTIKHFWSVVHELDDEDKKKLLMFTTGSDRVPIRGLSSLRLTITKNGDDSDRLPVAHTCFSILLLPAYATREKLQERLHVALQNSEGFGTM